MSIQILRRSLGGSRLVRDYLAGTGEAARFYRGNPSDPDVFAAKAVELDGASHETRLATASSIIVPAGDRGREALDRVVGASGYFVTTGQQPGLLGGPLYSLYKALTAVRLAEHLAGVLGKPVMPLFWVASEDHDWDEANHTHVIDSLNELHKLDLGAREDVVPRSMARTPLGPRAADVVATLGELLPHTPFIRHYMDTLEKTHRRDATVASGFIAVMRTLLEDTPVGFVDASDPALKAASRPVLRAEVRQSEASEAALAATSSALQDAGYGLQVPLLRKGLNLFVETDAGRERVYRTDKGFILRHSRTSISLDALEDRIDRAPETVSPNVLLRPVVESFVFPTLAYVGGPGELAYFGQLPGLFRQHGVGMPVAVPRASFVVVENTVSKVLDAFSLSIDALKDGDTLLTRLAKDDVPESVDTAIADWRGSLEGLERRLGEAVAGIDPTLEGAVTRARNAGLGALARLEKKIVRAVKRKNETVTAQIRRAQANLWPAGNPQDRMITPLQYAMRYGPAFVEWVSDEIQVDLGVGKA